MFVTELETKELPKCSWLDDKMETLLDHSSFHQVGCEYLQGVRHSSQTRRLDVLNEIAMEKTHMSYELEAELYTMLHGYGYGTRTGYGYGYGVRKFCKNWGTGTAIYIYIYIYLKI